MATLNVSEDHRRLPTILLTVLLLICAVTAYNPPAGRFSWMLEVGPGLVGVPARAGSRPAWGPSPQKVPAQAGTRPARGPGPDDNSPHRGGIGPSCLGKYWEYVGNI